jgi:hypothetical protein
MAGPVVFGAQDALISKSVSHASTLAFCTSSVDFWRGVWADAPW